MLKKLWLIHPFLFALVPIIFLFAYNIDEVPADALLLPMLVVIIGTLILFSLLRLVTKNYHKVAIITSYFWILFFSYGHVRSLLPSSLEIAGAKIYCGVFLGLLWVLLCIIGAFLVIKSRTNFLTFSKVLSIIAMTLVIISLINISIYEVKTFSRVPEEVNGVNGENASLNLGNPDNLPDIYYIILDTYARQDTLEEVFGYDNSEFIDYLTSKGFYVATKSCSNYDCTGESLPSCLNMDYLTAEELANKSTLVEMSRNSEVSRLLKEKGYRYVAVSSGEVIKGIAEYTDVYLAYKSESILRKSAFMEYFLHSTALLPFTILYLQDFLDESDRNAILYVFDELADIPNIEEPTFVYAHIMSPHPPFIFDRDGNPPEQKISYWIDEDYRPLSDSPYVDQLIFINKKVKTLVDEIVSKSDIAPIIILQADHGIYWGIYWGEGKNFDIINAYYLPGKDNQLLYETISPVNSFRVVFNLYFNMDYELLEDYCDNLESEK